MKCEICGKEIEKSSYAGAILCSSECFTKYYWKQRVDNKDSKTQVVVNGEMYQIGDEQDKGSRGFFGHQFIIKFFDGRVVITTNLWYNGVIPEEFRKDLPDNAKFIPLKELSL